MKHSEEQDLSLQPTRALSFEEFETFRALNSSPHWKAYRDLLIKSKDAQFQSLLPESDPNKIMKGIGLVAGINFAINQLPLLIAQHDLQIKKQQELAIAKENAKARKRDN